ncbi:MAG: hypothetical protein R2879_22700 [Saprospiraceae bacterium]
MNDFKEVSLGFAEFVSQLIQETFDAIQSSQNYQLERFAALESKLNLSDEIFANRYVSSEEIEHKIQEFFGFSISEGMKINERLLEFFDENFESNNGFFKNSILTKFGHQTLTDYFTSILVSEKKALVNVLVNKSNGTNLVVDSGEILAKLELSNLYQEDSSQGSKPAQKKVSFEDEAIKKANLSTQTAIPGFKKKIDILNIKDDKSGKTTILIDKNSLNEIQSNFQLPDVRLAVQPAKITSENNLYSEIKIKFKTV